MTSLAVLPRFNQEPTTLDHVAISVSPDARLVAVVENGPGSDGTTRLAHIYTVSGRLVWRSSDHVAWFASTQWSPDGRKFAIDSVGRWLVANLADETKVTTATIDAGSRLERFERPRLLGFAEDGRRLYGAVLNSYPPTMQPIFAGTPGGGTVKRLAALPTARGQRLAQPLDLRNPVPNGAAIDSRTGSVAYITGAQDNVLRLTVRRGRVSHELPIDAAPNSVLQMAWQGRSILVLRDDDTGLNLAQDLDLYTWGSKPMFERRVAAFEVKGQHGTLVSVSKGYAVLAFGRGLPEVRNRLLIVRLKDAFGTLIDPDGRLATKEIYGFAGWLSLSAR
jgi:hypothetical protein